MKQNRVKILLIVVITIVSVWSLYPTYRDYALTKKIESLASSRDSLQFLLDHRNEIEQAREKSLKLGLDLKGGMHLVMEVDLLDLIDQKAWNKDERFYRIMANVKSRSANSGANVVDLLASEFRKENVRLSRYFYDIRNSDREIVDKLNKEAQDALSRAKEVIRNRIDQYGVAEPVIQAQGTRRLIIELSGVTDEARVRKLLKGTAKLEFKLLKDRETLLRTLDRINTTLSQSDAAGAAPDSAFAGMPPTGADSLVQKSASFRPLFEVADEYSRDYVASLLAREDVRALLPQDTELLLSAKPDENVKGEKFYSLFLVKKSPELTGGVITEAKATFGSQNVQPEVLMEMNSEGTAKWARITGANIGKRIAIVLDGVVYSAPVVQSKIPNGNSVINGISSLEEAKDLEIILKAGALPAPVRIIEERTVGPSLGSDYIRAGMLSIIWGFTAVALFMIVYYHKAGIAADLALVLNILIVISVLAGFSAALTLPGIAGIVLTMGMAVDANVLIYERIREELDEGKQLKLAVDTGYKKAFSSIFDSHVTTLSAAFLLYVYGIGPIQGFAVTLMIGTAASLFTAIVVTRLIFDLLLGTSFMNEKSFG
jgi:preprotein translocase subunit SecD